MENYSVYYGGDPRGTLFQPVEVVILDETMRSDDDKRHRGFKPCEHFSHKVIDHQTPFVTNDRWYENTPYHAKGYWINKPPLPASNCWNGALGDTGCVPSLEFGTWDSPTKGLPTLVVLEPWGKTVSLPSDLRALQQESLDIMLPGIRPKLSLVNSIYELKDFKTLPRSINKIRKTIGLKPFKVFRNLWGTQKGTRRTALTFRELLRTASDSYLQWSFNIAPLVSDIYGIYKSLVNVRNELKNLIKNAGKRQVRHYRRMLSNQYANENETRTAVTPTKRVQRTAIWYRQVTYSHRHFYATLKYSYTLPSVRYELALIDSYLDALGVNLNPAIIWNAIPWTFVLDWVVGVSQLLSRLKLRNIEPITVIHGYCWSIHVRRTITCGFGYGSTLPLGDHIEEAYYRSLGMPNLWSSIRTSGVNLKEFSLATALATSR